MQLLKYIQAGFVQMVAVVFSLSAAMAQVSPPVSEFVKPLTGTTLLVNATATVENEFFFNSAYSVNIDTPYPVKNIITLGINESYTGYLPNSFTAIVTVQITYTNAALAQNTVTRDLVVHYDTASAYKSRDVFAFSGAQRVAVKVTGMQVVTTAGQSLVGNSQPYLILENKMQVQPAYKFNCTTTVGALTATDSAKLNPDELYVSWGQVTGAHEYDVEWAYVDSSSFKAVYHQVINPTSFFDNNASRVSVKGFMYAIPLMYSDSGYLCFRVRPVQYKKQQRFEGAWTVVTPPGAGIYAFKGHERALNWQSTISYAEDGKRKVVVQYYDGSLRGRQTVTKDNTANRTIVAESLYDYQGRPVIQVLPVPTLNSIIGYSRNFTVGLNGSEYAKSSYDTLPDPSAYCGASGDAMGTASGASRYYSPANTDKSGLNSYIPDAEGYPFTETQYTQDATGRISKQSGVGRNYKLGSGHETRYYYGTPSQGELDALFGTEVGDKSHYFKNAVQDANGQYSVSYVDMYGRTIATALAGAAPAGVEALNSNIALFSTEKLADSSSAVFRDKTIEHKKSLVVDTQGDFVFKYKLDPETLVKEGCLSGASICYNCLYDLRITITDDCNNQKLPGKTAFEKVFRNFSLERIDTGCKAPGFDTSFTLNLLPGSYEITKQLSISNYGMDYLRTNVFLPKNTCSSLQTFVSEQRALVKQRLQCTPVCDSCKVADATSEIRSAMLLDLTPPSGQYADPDKTGSKYSVFYAAADAPARYQAASIVYRDENRMLDYVTDDRTGELVTPDKLNAEQFAAKFKASWAEALLPLHPEYCKLSAYENFRSSNAWDRTFEQTDTYLDALGKGYLNPTGKSTALFNRFTPATTFKDPFATNGAVSVLENKMTNYVSAKLNVKGVSRDTVLSMWTMASMSVKLSGADTFGVYRCHLYPFDATATCEGDLNMAWRNFRSLYLQAKKDVVDQLVMSACASDANTPSASQLVAADFIPNFNSVNGAIAAGGLGFTQTTISAGVYADSAAKAMTALYDANCRAYATLWAQQLSCYNQSQLDIIIPRLIQVCKEGADEQHTNGSSTVRPASTYKYRSFADVINEFNAQNSSVNVLTCNAELITAPKPYESPLAYNNITLYSKPDDCQCATIQALHESYQRSNRGTANFSAYVKLVRNTEVSEADLATLLSMCNGTYLNCNYLARPIQLPPALQCGMQNICATCDQVSGYYQSYQTTYPSMAPSPVDTAEAQQQKNVMFERFMNNRLGFSKTAAEYLEFIQQCGNIQQNFQTVCRNEPYGEKWTIKKTASFMTEYGCTANVVVSDMKPVKNNGFIAIAHQIDSDPCKLSFIIRIDSLNKITWARTLGDSRKNILFDKVCVTQKGEFVIGGASAGNEVMLKLDSAGQQYVWPPRTLLAGQGSIVKCLDIKEGTNGRILGTYYNSYQSGYRLLVFDSLGGVQFGRTIDPGGPAMDSTGGRMVIDGNVVWLTANTRPDYDNGPEYYPRNGILAINYINGDYTGVPQAYINSGGYRGYQDPEYMWAHTSFEELFLVGNVFKVKATTHYGFEYGYDDNGGAIIYDKVSLLTIDKQTGQLLSAYRIVGDSTVTGEWDIENPNKKQVALYVDPVGNIATTIYDPLSANVKFQKLNATNNVVYARNFPAATKVSVFARGGNGRFIGMGAIDSSLVIRNLDLDSANACSSIVTSSNPQPEVFEWWGSGDFSISYLNTGLLTQFVMPQGSLRDFTKSFKKEALCTYVKCTKEYSGAFLCGTTMPVFDIGRLKNDEVTNCSDSSFFIQSKAAELYAVYKDSVKGRFDNDYIAKCLNAYRYEVFTVTKSASEYHYTLYYYDQAGNLVKTVPPAGVRANRDTNWLKQVVLTRKANGKLTPVHELATLYRYNTLNQVAEQKTPDAGISRFWYDRLGRLAVSQNAKQILSNQYSYTQYDQLGRITQVGQLMQTTAITDVTSRNDVALQQWLATAAGSREQITVTLYDEPYVATSLAMRAVNLRNRVSYSALYNNAADLSASGNPFATATFYSYDIHGNVDTLLQYYKEGAMRANPGNGLKKMVYQYDLVSGKVNHVAYQPGERDAFYHRYIYDAENRITNAETSHDSIHWENEAWYNYYKHGPLARTVLGHLKVQASDYIYTLQGWIKAVNPGVLLTGGTTGTGTNCSSNTALDNLVVNTRLSGGPATYTARSSITFESGFLSNPVDEFTTDLNSSLPICTAEQIPGGTVVDGSSITTPASDEYSYVLHYNSNDFKAINAAAPDALTPAQLGAEYRPLYNGNISGMGVSVNKLGSPQWYNYQYDQLNRLVKMDMWAAGSNTWSDMQKKMDYSESIRYDANGNIMRYLRNGNSTGGGPLQMDNLTYHYETGKNRLGYITDSVPAGNYAVDIDNQPVGNYAYDSIGNLIKDDSANIEKIEWTVYGKIKSIKKKNGITVFYAYDAAGNRISKIYGTDTTCYVRDVQGNVMSVYHSGDASVNSGHFTQTELPLYGSSRLGIYKSNVDMLTADPADINLAGLGDAKIYNFTRGEKLFELSNHLGNVLATVSDRRMQVGAGSTLSYYTADVVSAQDYYPFGMLQPGRSYNAGGYRCGFNGKENDNEVKGEGNQQDYGMRIYDPRIAKFLSVDPLTPKYPELTPYQFASNRPIDGIDLDGKEWLPVVQWMVTTYFEWKYGISTGLSNIKSGIEERYVVESGQASYQNENVPKHVQQRLDNVNSRNANLKIGTGVATLTSKIVETSFDITTTVAPADGLIVATKDAVNLFRYSLKTKRLATTTAKELIQVLPKKNIPTTVTIIVDEATGKVYPGISGAVKSVEELEPAVRSLLPKESLEKWPVFQCADCDALNAAVKDGARLKDLHMYTVKIHKKEGTIKAMERCSNCKVTTKDIKATHSDK